MGNTKRANQTEPGPAVARAKAGHSPGKSNKAAREARKAAARRKAKRNRLLWVGTGVLVAGVFVASFYLGRQSGVTDPGSWDLPAMGATAQTQDRVTLADYQGGPTVVNFFASWCVECDRELPGFARVSDELQNQVQFVGVASQETGNPLLMPERHGVDWWPLARDIGGSNGSGLSTALGARGMPLTAFYDDRGALLHVQLGSITEPQLKSFIAQFYGIET